MTELSTSANDEMAKTTNKQSTLISDMFF